RFERHAIPISTLRSRGHFASRRIHTSSFAWRGLMFSILPSLAYRNVCSKLPLLAEKFAQYHLPDFCNWPQNLISDRYFSFGAPLGAVMEIPNAEYISWRNFREWVAF